ncbi:MAG: hypothetical protein R2824_08085 [Saprospiraceae bacterium]|nr:hypothetical protein [Lewinella sp.]
MLQNINRLTFVDMELSDSLLLHFNKFGRITALLTSPANLQKLLELDAGHNISGIQVKGKEKMRILDERIFNLKSLKYLHLYNQGLPVLPDIPENHTLEGLNLAGNAFSELPYVVGQLKSLRYINLAGNDLTAFPMNVRLEKLKSLSISPKSSAIHRNMEIRSGFSEYFPALSDLSVHGYDTLIIRDFSLDLNLQILYFTANFIAVDAMETDTLVRSGHFVLQGKTIDGRSGSYPNVPEMEIRETEADALPSSLRNNTNLKKLSFSSANFGRLSFTALPESIRYIHFAVDNITEVDEDINRLKALNYVAFNNNLITEVPRIDLPELNELNLSGNKIRIIRYLPAAREITFLGNEIESIDDSVTFPDKLEVLDLAINDLPVIPSALAKAETLKELDLSENEITEIPDFIPALSNILVGGELGPLHK